MSEWFYYRFRCRVRPESLHGRLCRFFKADEPDFEELELTETQMVLEALSAYCMPLVFKRLKEIGKCSEAAFKHCGRVSFNQLIQRAYFIAHVCGLEGELVLIPALGPCHPHQPNHELSNGSHLVVNKSKVEVSPQESNGRFSELVIELPSDDLAPQNLLHHEDDAVFESMFGEQ